MSIGKNITRIRDLQEEFTHHSEESAYHLEQYLRALEDVETHYKKFREHSARRDQYSFQLKEVSDVAS